MNKYLEKIAVFGAGIGFLSSNRHDGIGGAVSGEIAGHVAAKAAFKALPIHLKVPGLAAGYVGGAYLGGKAYSKAKSVLSTPEPKKETKD